MVPTDRNTGRVDLGKTRIGKKSSPFMGFPSGRGIAAHGVGGQIKDVSIASGAEQDGMTEMAFQLSGNQISNDHSPGLPINDHQIQHFMAGILFHITQGYLPFQGLVGTDQQLLAGLACRIESTLYLSSSERAIGK